jgi:hypothetical protein
MALMYRIYKVENVRNVCVKDSCDGDVYPEEFEMLKMFRQPFQPFDPQSNLFETVEAAVEFLDKSQGSLFASEYAILPTYIV